MVKEIKEVSTPLQLQVWGDIELTTDIKVPLREWKAPNKITLQVPLANLRRNRKCCRIDSPSSGECRTLDVEWHA